MDVKDILEQMAYDLTQNEEFSKKVKKEKEKLESRELSPEAYTARFKAMMKGG